MAMALEGKCYNCGSAQQNPASPTCYRCGTCQHTNEEEEDEEDGEGLTEAEQQIYDTIPDLYNTNWEIEGEGELVKAELEERVKISRGLAPPAPGGVAGRMETQEVAAEGKGKDTEENEDEKAKKEKAEQSGGKRRRLRDEDEKAEKEEDEVRKEDEARYEDEVRNEDDEENHAKKRKTRTL